VPDPSNLACRPVPLKPPDPVPVPASTMVTLPPVFAKRDDPAIVVPNVIPLKFSVMVLAIELPIRLIDSMKDAKETENFLDLKLRSFIALPII
jgi:hypothetical protein